MPRKGEIIATLTMVTTIIKPYEVDYQSGKWSNYGLLPLSIPTRWKGEDLYTLAFPLLNTNYYYSLFKQCYYALIINCKYIYRFFSLQV